ncbi:hypothetical protein [Shinella sumterensis]|uniref:hypothetical protein n=1 Tax=Shinella sumterensis TaxID=1967501 RepID=UPI0035185E04
MVARIPTVQRDIDSPAEGYFVIDDQHLLMVGTPDGMFSVQFHGNPRMPFPSQEVGQVGRPHPTCEECGAPQEYSDLEIGILACQPENEVANLARRAVIDIRSTERRTCIEVPSYKEYGMPSGSHDIADRTEIIVGIDDDRKIVCPRNTPAVGSGPEH